MTRTHTTPAYAAFHQLIATLRGRVLALEQRPGGALPIVDADPAAGGRIRAWIMTDGRLRWRDYAGVVHEAAEAAPGPATSAPSLPDAEQSVHTFSQTFTAEWVASFGPGAPVAGDYGDGVRAMIGFGAAPGAALADAVSVSAVEVWLYQEATRAGAVPVGIGTHGVQDTPATYSGSAPLSRVDLPALGSPGWVRIARDIAWRLREGDYGLVIDQSATGGVAGRIAAAPPRSPQIRLTYRS